MTDLPERLRAHSTAIMATVIAGAAGPKPNWKAIPADLAEAAVGLERYKQALYDCDFHLGLGEPKNGTEAEIRETVRSALGIDP